MTTLSKIVSSDTIKVMTDKTNAIIDNVYTKDEVIPVTDKGVASGVAELDASGNVLDGSGAVINGKVTSVNSKSGAVTLGASDVGAEPAFTKNSAFNQNFGGNGVANTVSRSDHNHSGVYEPTFTKNTAFNKSFGTDASTVAEGKNLRIYAEQTDFKTYKSNKDANDIFTTVQYKRADGTLAIQSVLSGGTSPQYTTRTITYYGTNGTTVEKTTTRTLSYDANGDLVSEV